MPRSPSRRVEKAGMSRPVVFIGGRVAGKWGLGNPEIGWVVWSEVVSFGAFRSGTGVAT